MKRIDLSGLHADSETEGTGTPRDPNKPFPLLYTSLYESTVGSLSPLMQHSSLELTTPRMGMFQKISLVSAERRPQMNEVYVVVWDNGYHVYVHYHRQYVITIVVQKGTRWQIPVSALHSMVEEYENSSTEFGAKWVRSRMYLYNKFDENLMFISNSRKRVPTLIEFLEQPVPKYNAKDILSSVDDPEFYTSENLDLGLQANQKVKDRLLQMSMKGSKRMKRPRRRGGSNISSSGRRVVPAFDLEEEEDEEEDDMPTQREMTERTAGDWDEDWEIRTPRERRTLTSVSRVIEQFEVEDPLDALRNSRNKARVCGVCSGFGCLLVTALCLLCFCCLCTLVAALLVYIVVSHSIFFTQ